MPHQLLSCLSAELWLLGRVECVDVTWWELGGQVCGVFRALLTYCLLGTSGLGLQTVLLFVSTAWQNVCSPQKGIKLLFLQLPCATRLVLQAQARPQCRLSQPHSAACAHVACAMAGGLLGRQPAPDLKAAEPLAAAWALRACVLTSLQESACPPWKQGHTGTSNARA